MKFLVLAALIAVAAAFPDERVRRSAVLGLAAPGTVVQGASALLSGPSGVVSANTGAIATGAAVPAAAVLAAPSAVVVAPAQTAGAVIANGATLVGPSTAGAPGVVAVNGHGLGLGLGGLGLLGHGPVVWG